MIDNKAAAEKKNFVESISNALVFLEEPVKVQYKSFPDQYQEYLKLTYTGGNYEFINVTGDSLKTIFIEIAAAVNNQPRSIVVDMRMLDLVDTWWNAAR